MTIWVPGEAKTERKRQRIVTPASGRSFVGARTDEPDRKDYKAWVRLCLRQACPQPMHGPLALTVTVVRTKPASAPKNPTNKHPWPWAAMSRPDADNYVKILADCCNGIAWIDDGQVVALTVYKVYGEAPGVLLSVDEVTEDGMAAHASYATAQARRRPVATGVVHSASEALETIQGE